MEVKQMINVGFIVNNYMQTQGANSVIDQFLINKDKFASLGICIKAVFDYRKEYYEVPSREEYKDSNNIVKASKKMSLSDTLLYDFFALEREKYRYGTLFYKNFVKLDTSKFDILVFQDLYAAAEYLNKSSKGGPIICYLTHMYEDPLAQLLINRRHIGGTVIERWLRNKYRMVFDNCNTIFTICDHAREALLKHTDNQNIETVYNSVSISQIKTRPGTHKRINIVMASSISERKGFDLLMEALKDLPKRYSDEINITVYGTGNYYEKANEIKNTYHIDYIHFKGKTKEPYRYYGDEDILMLTSRDETLPMSILEAMQIGLPVISTNVGAVNEMVFDKENGILIGNASVHDIQEGIKRLVNSRSEIPGWGERAREIYYLKFSTDIWITAFAEAFSRLFEQN